MTTGVKLQVESEAAAKVFLPEAMPRWLVERYHSPEVRGSSSQGVGNRKPCCCTVDAWWSVSDEAPTLACLSMLLLARVGVVF